jgi:hypothetical protein
MVETLRTSLPQASIVGAKFHAAPLAFMAQEGYTQVKRIHLRLT